VEAICLILGGYALRLHFQRILVQERIWLLTSLEPLITCYRNIAVLNEEGSTCSVGEIFNSQNFAKTFGNICLLPELRYFSAPINYELRIYI